MRRVFLRIGLLVLFGVHPLGMAAERPPNFVVILADDLGYGDLGCYGRTKIKTPNIDRMAAEGLRFTNFYAQTVCGPSRAALMTGCYPIRVAEPGNRKHEHTILHSQEITLAELLKSRGYATACIGKWHLGLSDRSRPSRWDPATMPNGQGFDYFYGTPVFNGHSARVSDVPFRSPILRNQKVVVSAVENWDTITRDYTAEAIRWMENHRDRPFFLYLAHNMPHVPLGASEAFRGKSAAGPYGDAVEELDWSVGRLLESLRRQKLDEQTLVIFTSDNGPWIETTRGNEPGGKPFLPRNHSGDAGPLRGHKMLTWEGGLRVPCVARWPGKISARTTDALCTTMDFLPTFAALARAALPAGRTIDGKDIVAVLLGGSAAPGPPGDFFYYSFTHLQAVRSGEWKLVLPRPEHPAWTGFSGRFHGDGVKDFALYNLREDIGEQHDVAARHPELIGRLRKLADRAREQLGDHDRIGKGARFFDNGPRRPEVLKQAD